MDILNQIELRHLRYFLAVAEELSFSRAADRLGIAQPPLSQQIQRLEEMLDVSLFDRRPKVRLTEAGEILVREARRTLLQAQNGLEDVIRVGRGEVGKLVIGFASSIQFGPLPELIRTYRKQFPKVRLFLQEMTSNEQQKALMNGTIDIGLLRESPIEEGLTCEIILDEPFVVALPSDHRLAKQSRIDVADLADEAFVFLPREVAPSIYDRTIEFFSKAGFAPHIDQEAINWITMVSLVEVGFGVSLVPSSFRKLKWGNVKYRRLRSKDLRTNVSVCFKKENLSYPATEFIRLVREARSLEKT